MREKLASAFSNLLDSAISAVPKIFVGIVLVAAGLVAAKLVEVVLRFLLTRLRFDRLMEKAGIDKMLQRIGLRQQLNLILPRLAYFLTLLVLARTASDAMGLDAIAVAIGSFFNYLPNIIAALLLLIVGASISQFAGSTVAQAAKNAGLDFAPSLGRIISALIMFVVTMMAIGQLKIDTEMVRIVTSFILAGMALAFGLSFGLGTRDVVRNLTAGFYLRKHLLIGRPVEIAGQRGVLKAFTPTHAILEGETGEISLANATFFDLIAKQ